jgi:hypothetical protein
MSEQDWNPPPHDPGPGAPPPAGGAPPPPPPEWGAAPPPGGTGGTGGTGAAPLPWEDRERLGFIPALVDTVKLLTVSPGSAYRRARQQGDFFSPLLYALLVGGLAAIVGHIWSSLFQATYLSWFLPPDTYDKIAPMLATTVAGVVMGIVLAPVGVVVTVFVWSGILHLFAMMVGATKTSRAGFEGTFRAVAYAQTAALAQVVPLVGAPVSVVWGFVLQIVGLSELHRTSTGKAAAAVLLPTAVCCLGVGALVALAVAMMASAIGGMN